MNQVVAAAGDRVGQRVVREQPDDRGRQRLAVVRLDEQPADAVFDHFRDPAHRRRHDRAAERHRLQHAEALGLAIRRQDRDVQRGRDCRHVLAPACEDDPSGDAKDVGLGLQGVLLRALADDEKPGVGDGGEDQRPGVEQGAVALLRLESSHDAHDRGLGIDVVILVQRAAGLLMVVALQVDAVVDEADGRAPAPFVGDLLLDGLRDDDQTIHQRRELTECFAVLGAADAARMHRRNDHRAAAALLTEMEGGLGADDLGPEHVVVDDLGLEIAELLGQRQDGHPIVRLVDHRRFDARLLQPADAAAVGERDNPDLVAGRVQPRGEREDVLLRPAVGAGGHDLHDPHPPTGEWPTLVGLVTGLLVAVVAFVDAHR